MAEAADVPAGSRGLLALPYFAGERTPLFDLDARGVIAGRTLGHGRAELYRAVPEGIAYGVRHNLEAMAGGQTRRLVAVGEPEQPPTTTSYQKRAGHAAVTDRYGWPGL
ncbi:FGGY-family carbohydrate kinase [Nocardia sp. NPDC050412]|uniref:FGGY-family carbohydrate kinase n=1 Tax=unclassified Nocardia TaxID=2637762 RepID=UPI0037A4728D